MSANMFESGMACLSERLQNEHPSDALVVPLRLASIREAAIAGEGFQVAVFVGRPFGL